MLHFIFPWLCSHWFWFYYELYLILSSICHKNFYCRCFSFMWAPRSLTVNKILWMFSLIRMLHRMFSKKLTNCTFFFSLFRFSSSAFIWASNVLYHPCQLALWSPFYTCHLSFFSSLFLFFINSRCNHHIFHPTGFITFQGFNEWRLIIFSTTKEIYWLNWCSTSLCFRFVWLVCFSSTFSREMAMMSCSVTARFQHCLTWRFGFRKKVSFFCSSLFFSNSSWVSLKIVDTLLFSSCLPFTMLYLQTPPNFWWQPYAITSGKGKFLQKSKRDW